MTAAAGRVSGDVMDALRRSIAQVREYQQHIMPTPPPTLKRPGVELGLRFTPLDSAGLYFPGGKASYPSSLIMLAVPAQVQASNDDVPLLLHTAPELEQTAFGTTLSSVNADSLVIETDVDANGRVQDYRILSDSKDSEQLLPQVKRMLIFTTFRPAMSMGRPRRPSGVRAAVCSWYPGSSAVDAYNGVSVAPGATALTVMPGPSSRAATRTSWESAAFDVE